MIKVKRALLKYMKRRRFDRAKLRPDTLDVGRANLSKVQKI